MFNFKLCIDFYKLTAILLIMSQQITLVGIDPGETTGIVKAVWDIESKEFNILGVFELTKKELIKLAIMPRFAFGKYDYMVIEDFKLYAHKKNEMVNNRFEAVKVIGLMEFIHFHVKKPSSLFIDRLIYQGANFIKGSPPVSIRDQYKSHFKDKRHARDAFRHLRYFVRTNKNWL